VHPVPADALQRVETTLRLPVAREMGRSQLALTVDRFLGQGRASATVLVELRTAEPLTEMDVEGARPRVLARTERSARLAFSADTPVELWWTERGAPLGLGAEAVPLEDGSLAVALRVALNDAGAWRAPYRALHLFVDASFSMRRRRAALAQLMDRLQDQSPVPVFLHAVAERTLAVRLSGDAEADVRPLLSGQAGHAARGAVQVFKRHGTGEVRRELAWYRLDDGGPQVSVRADVSAGVLHVVPAEGHEDVSSVRLEAAGGQARTLSPLAGEWKASLAELPESFTVVVRDRAGNASHWSFTWKDGELRPAREQRAVAAAPTLPRQVPALRLEGRGLRLAGGDVELEAEGHTPRFEHARAPLGSLALGAVLRLDCPAGDGRCTPRVLATFPHHPVTGLVRLEAERVLVGVLGEGLRELRGEDMLEVDGGVLLLTTEGAVLLPGESGARQQHAARRRARP
jgi:hypothetical protein